MKHIFLISLFLVFCFTDALAQNCSFTASLYKGCIPLPVSFKASVSGTPKQYIWFFGDGDSSAQISPSHVYTKPGSYYPLLIVLYADGTSCRAKTSQPVNVFENPNADMNIQNGQNIILCNRGQAFCFKDMSRPGSSKSPIKQWVWSFGDGTLNIDQNPCYSYSDSGTYTVILEATDSNGCRDIVKRKIHISFISDTGKNLKPYFSTERIYDCHKNQIIMNFKNLTDTVGFGVTKFRWDFSDGTYTDCDLTNPNCKNEWLTQTHIYNKEGQYFPTLTVYTKYGCVAYYQWDTGIFIPNYHFDVSIFPSTVFCITSNSPIAFNTPYHPYASYYRWNFGDPEDTGYGRSPAMMHLYTKPGTYTVTLEVKIGSCIYDTVLCNKIHIYGPEALIMPHKQQFENPDHTDWITAVPIPLSEYPSYFNDSCNGPPDVDYYVHDTTFVPNGDTTFSYCTADTVKTIIDSVFDCTIMKKVAKKRYIIQPGIVSVKDLVIPTADHYIWHPGDPWPAYPVFRASVAIDSPLIMNDTQFIAPQCSAPHRVTFTNFSTKNRGYFAVDNDPQAIKEKCINPSAPFASDSLSYDWDFREGVPGISTSKFPDERKRNSTEITPTHLYTKSGCYWAYLRVTDPKTHCVDFDSVPIVLQGADAGWDASYNTNRMTWVHQDTLPYGSPRRGMILLGPPCVNTNQIIDLKETLPSCYKPELAMIIDSAQQSMNCGTGKVRMKWIRKEDLESKHYKIKYSDTGWKTLALVIRNNYNCYDTVWYSHYKYFFKLLPQLVPENPQVCIGEPIILNLEYPDQPGIKLHYSKFTFYDVGGKNKSLGVDTFPYNVIHKNDTVTSTVHNKDWGIDDGLLNFNYLTDTIRKIIDTPGHLLIKSMMVSRFGCIDSAYSQVMIGHFADFDVSKRILCAGDTVRFKDSIHYFTPINGPNDNGIQLTRFWDDPIGVRNGRKPLKAEKMYWDFNNDGIIDDSTSNPIFFYNKPGKYPVTLTTVDSNGCKQVLTKKDFITVISPVAKFVVDSPGDVRYCAPAFFRFLDSSYVTVPGDTLSNLHIYSWTWDYGDSSAPVTVYDPNKNSHFYTKNGDYLVKLTVSTSPATGSGNKGCQATYSKLIRILGPAADFIPITPLEGCMPLTVKFLNRNKNASVQEWKTGSGSSFSSTNDTITMRYLKPGVYCPSVVVADTIVDILGNRLYCKDSAPTPACLYKVIVHKPDVIHLLATDTLLCAGQTNGTFSGYPDTGYTAWQIDYGNGNTQSGTKPVFHYVYPQAGHYTIKLTGTGAFCPEQANMNVRVIDVHAALGVDSMKRDTPVFTFKNYSIDAVRYKWDFGDGTPPVYTYSKDPISHTFVRSGPVQICLTAYNEKDCPDEACLDINITTGVWVPNVFTPQGDNYNSTFRINIWGQTLYHLEIYNRWGQMVFHSDDRNHQWNGNDERSGMPCVPGTYFFVFNYQLIGEKAKTISGTVDLRR